MLTARRAFWFLWCVLLIAKLCVASSLPLFGDEAWYWLESRHPAWAYSDLPGLTAWLIGFGTWIGGDSWLGVRWPFLMLAMLVPWLVVRFAARWFGEADGWQAGLLALLFPLLGGLGFLALPDVPLTVAAMLCLDACARLRERVDTRALAWLALGLTLGALSHYRFALLIAAGALGLLADARGRQVLRDVRVIAALALGVVAWWPLLHWNLAHAHAGLAFQLRDRHPWSLHGGGFVFLLGQVIVLGPAMLLLLLASLRHAWRMRHADTARPWLLIVASAAAPVLAYATLAFVADRDRVSFHWLLQAWLPLVAVAPMVLAQWSRSARGMLVATTAALLLATFGFVAMAAWPAWRADWAHSRWYPDNFAGWQEIADALELPSRAGGTAPLLADNFMLGAQLAFASGTHDIAILDHPLNHKHGRAAQLALWRLVPDAAASRQQAWTLVVEDSAVAPRDRLAYYRQLCERLGRLPSPAVINVDHGRKRFLRFDLGAPGGGDASECTLPALAWIDSPGRSDTVSGRVQVGGWAFKDGAGIAAVEILLDGKVVTMARYGDPQPRVAAYWHGSSDPAHPDVGFTAQFDASAVAPGVHWLGLRLHGRDGSVEDWPEQRLVISAP